MKKRPSVPGARRSVAALFAAIGASLWLAAPAPAAAAPAAVTNSLTVAIDARNPGPAIPADFVGASVSSMSIGGAGGYTRCFTTAHPQLVTLCRQIGIKHFRTIMGRAKAGVPDPTPADVDAFFDFAAAAGVDKIIWSLHLYNAGAAARWSNNRALAAHIWTTTTSHGTVERQMLDSFAFDNEPDWLRALHTADPAVTGYDTPAATGGYLGRWRAWQQIIAALAPGAKFSGPDTGSKWPCPGETDTSAGGVPFTVRFATDEAGVIATASQHFYGATAIARFTPRQLATACLSADWLSGNYPLMENAIIKKLPVPWRFTECSPFNNSLNAGNQCFATALWAVDFYHWWAARGCAGVDPFTRTVQYNSPIFLDHGNYVAEAVAYGMKAFALSSQGRVLPAGDLVLGNPDQVNVTAYGVVNPRHLYVTIVNKTFAVTGARTAAITLPPPAGFTVRAASYLLLAAGAAPGAAGDPTLTGANLGGAEIPNDGTAWAGVWTPLPVTRGAVRLTVPPTTAAIIDLAGDATPRGPGQ